MEEYPPDDVDEFGYRWGCTHCNWVGRRAQCIVGELQPEITVSISFGKMAFKSLFCPRCNTHLGYYQE